MLILKECFLKSNNFFYLDGIDLFLDLKVLQEILPKGKKKEKRKKKKRQ